MNISIKSLHIENFKGITALDVNFNGNTTISGANAVGKTTIFDAVTWLLWNKNSLGVEKFDIRPIDSNGKQIDFVEIFVSGVFDKDGEEFSLEKRQKQKWTKHVGEEVSKFTGNINEYSVNGFPKSEQEYKAYIAGFINEEVFKLLSNPNYFASLKWKDQREILMKFATNESDLEIANKLGGFADIVPEFEKGATTADVMAKYKKALKEYKDKQKELPIRIDELNKQKVDFDIAELELAKAELDRRAMELNGPVDAEADSLKGLIMEDKFALSKMAQTLNSDNDAKRSELKNKLDSIEYKADAVSKKIDFINYEIKGMKAVVEQSKNEISRLGKEYFELKDKVYQPATTGPANGSTCPTCGQNMPAAIVSKAIAEYKNRCEEEKRVFEEKRVADLKALVENGNALKAKVADTEKLIANKESELQICTKEREQHVNTFGETMELYKAIPAYVEPTETPEYKAIEKRISDNEARLNVLADESRKRAFELSNVNFEREAINGKMAQAANNEKIEERIETLKAEQRTISQNVANCEKVLYQIDEFIKAKLDLISAGINNKFEKINFKLFNILVNGGVEECCEMTYNGVPYSTLNNGMKIAGGLDVIKTLSIFYGKEVFVFVDNAESVNLFNLPNMDCQLIRLVVTDDKELKVEKE